MCDGLKNKHFLFKNFCFDCFCKTIFSFSNKSLKILKIMNGSNEFVATEVEQLKLLYSKQYILSNYMCNQWKIRNDLLNK